MSEFPSNTHKQRAPEPEKREPKKITQVVEGKVVRRKKPFGRRFAETFMGDEPGSVWHYVALEVLLPAAKDMVTDAISQGVERMVYGEARSTSRRTGIRPGYTPYNRYSGPSGPVRREEPRREVSRRSRSQHNFDEIILATRVEADEVINRLVDLVDRYDSASVADLYELVGVSGNYTDDKWGWTDLDRVGVSRVRDGYLLDLPRPEQIT